jgi:Amidohydrolase family
MQEELDLVIEGGWVIDGTGAARRRADVGIRGERIAAIGDLSAAPAARRLDVGGRIVAPGFIDTHGHDDLMFVEKPGLEWKTSQGITSVVVGNCGISGAPAPLPGNTAAALALLGDSPLFADMAAYFGALQAQRPMINVAALVGHANLRLAAMPDPAAQPSVDQQQAMERMLAEALEAGAVGFSTGLAYQPGGVAGEAELDGLARVAAAHGALHTSHIRNEGDAVEAAVDEVLGIGRRTGCATVLSHHKCMMPANWGKSAATLANIDRARAAGVDVALDIYPYPGSSTILIPERADQIDDIRITWSTPHPECGGQSLAEIAARWGCDPGTGGAPPVPGGRDLLRHGRKRSAPHLPARMLHGGLRRPAQRRPSAPAPVGQFHARAGTLRARGRAADAGGRGGQDDLAAGARLRPGRSRPAGRGRLGRRGGVRRRHSVRPRYLGRADAGLGRHRARAGQWLPGVPGGARHASSRQDIAPRPQHRRRARSFPITSRTDPHRRQSR